MYLWMRRHIPPGRTGVRSVSSLTSPACIDLAMEMLESRRALGDARYGVPLTADDTRDLAREGWEEAADCLIYLAGARVQQLRKIAVLEERVKHLEEVLRNLGVEARR